MHRDISLLEIEDFLAKKKINFKIHGNKKQSFKDFCPLNSLKPNSITWVRDSNRLNVEKLNNVAGIVLVAELVTEDIKANNFPIIYAENAHRTYFRIIEYFFSEDNIENRQSGIASTAVVETEKIGQNVKIGHYTHIGPDVEIGHNVSIFDNVSIQGKVKIGDFTIIEAGTVIGVCGFGHYWDEDGNPHVVPHLGGVKIGKYVKIGANCGIARGCLADTIIEDYVQIDNLSHIAHNDYIKEGAILTANTVIAGSTTVGKKAWLAPGNVVINGVEVGDNVFSGLGTVVIRDIPDGKKVFGNPARVTGDM